jgi:hypothetical protein
MAAIIGQQGISRRSVHALFGKQMRDVDQFRHLDQPIAFRVAVTPLDLRHQAGLKVDETRRDRFGLAVSANSFREL